MEIMSQQQITRAVEDVLSRDDDPITKVQSIVDLGIDEELATDIVERYQIGQQAVVYYERLPSSDDNW